MDLVPVLLSRIRFAFVISVHIIFPAFTVGLAAWLATLEGTRLATGNPVYRRVFDFWLNVFALSFRMGRRHRNRHGVSVRGQPYCRNGPDRSRGRCSATKASPRSRLSQRRAQAREMTVPSKGATRHRVVIVGSGFGGLFAAKSLGRAPNSDRRHIDRSHQPPSVPAPLVSGGHGNRIRRTRSHPQRVMFLRTRKTFPSSWPR